MNDNVKAIPDGFHTLTPHIALSPTSATRHAFRLM